MGRKQERQAEKNGRFIMTIVRYSLKELKKQKSLTNWELIKKMGEPDLTDPDVPEITELLAKGLVRRVGRPRKENPKELISLRLDKNVLRKLRSFGRGWQTNLSNKISHWVSKGLL